MAELIAWWIDQDTGYPIPERSGVVRLLLRVSTIRFCGATARDELLDRVRGQSRSSDWARGPDQAEVATFIGAKLTDNRALMAADPGYLANLKALPAVEQARLLGGNWKIRPAAGLYFRRSGARSWMRLRQARKLCAIGFGGNGQDGIE